MACGHTLTYFGGVSLFLRQRSTAYRFCRDGTVVAERFGPLHRRELLLEWGSITKTVTATIAQRLSDEGALELSAPVSRYLPESKLPTQVDVDSLVTHTSGLKRLPSDILTSWSERKDPYSKYTNGYFDERIVPKLHEQQSGTQGQFDYSNLGYAVLTRVLETVTEQNWWRLARDHVFTPWGISDVAVNHADHLDSRDSTRLPRIRTWTGKPRETWIDTGPFVGAGGMLSTLDALESYAIAAHAHAGQEGLYGWMESPGLWWHNGHLRDQGAFLGISTSGDRVITAHTIGHRIGMADRLAKRVVSGAGPGL